MKRISKIVTACMTSLTVLLSSTAVAGAATCAQVPQVKVIRCDYAGCQDIPSALQKLCNERGCSLNTLLKNINGYCPDEECAEDTVQQPVPEQTAPVPDKPAQPAEQPAPVTVPADITGEFYAAYEAEVIRLVNVERAKYGLSPLSADDGASQVARVRAKEIEQVFSHTRPDGRSCFTAAADLGVTYRSAGENIAYGYQTPEQVVTGWMNSEGHRKNILSASYSKIGVGCRKSGGVWYWTQFFIG